MWYLQCFLIFLSHWPGFIAFFWNFKVRSFDWAFVSAWFNCVMNPLFYILVHYYIEMSKMKNALFLSVWAALLAESQSTVFTHLDRKAVLVMYPNRWFSAYSACFTCSQYKYWMSFTIQDRWKETGCFLSGFCSSSVVVHVFVGTLVEE